MSERRACNGSSSQLFLFLVRLIFIVSSISVIQCAKSFGIIPETKTRAATTLFSSSSTSSSAAAAVSGTATKMTKKEDRPYGSWISPITSKSITAGSVAIGGLHVTTSSSSSSSDTVYWTEGRSQEGGRNAVCLYDPSNTEHKSERDAVDVTPKTSNVRSRVHEYGGGAMTFASTTGEESNKAIDDALFYTEFTTQKLFRINLNDDDKSAVPVAVTNDDDSGQYRYANGVYDTKRKLLFCIREDHGPDGKASSKDVVNEIVALDVKTTSEASTSENNVRVLVTGYDFAVAPTLSLDGKTLACIVWDHPNMPWDSTKLIKVSLPDPSDDVLDPSSKVGEPTIVAGDDNDTSVLQPSYHPITGKLFYISDESGYNNIYMEDDTGRYNVLPMETDFGGHAPGWGLGQMGYTFLKDGRLIATYKSKQTGESVLVVANVMDWKNPSSGPVEFTEYTSKDGLPMQFGGINGGTTDATMNDLYFMGGSPGTSSSVYYWNLETKGDAKVLACSSKLKFDDEMISIPTQIEFPTTNEKTAFGYYYPPKNGQYESTTESSGPPLLVKAHGGPTAATGTTFNPSIQYWTSRGFAILDVDYGGSTGYGKSYRRRLRKSWGIVDIDDVCNGAKYLADKGLADPNRLCIDGGSAGGYTTLGALAFRDVFKAGCSLYGVADLTALAQDTHKFESRYLDGLIGSYPEDESIYKERSPIEHVDKLSCPILLLQGDEDKIVPPNQAEMMYEALKKKNIPTCLKIYKGEQHGFRKAENKEDALDSELSFYGKVFGIDVPDAIDLDIDNL